LELFLKHKPRHLQLLILSHLSQNNNHPEVVSKMFSAHAGSVKVVIASRHKESEVFTVESNQIVKITRSLKKPQPNKAQLSLFEF
jgi:hypothetical protein